MARIAGFALILAALMEVATLVLVGSRIGVGWTILLILAGFVAGALVIRSTGLSALRQARDAMARGEPAVLPLLATATGVCAGLLLMLPGFLSDLAALLLLLPLTRRWVSGRLGAGSGARDAGPDIRRTADGATVIDASYRVVETEVDVRLHPPGGRA